ncbi:cobyric acid synthase [Ignavigranum ruoffiae]|uniref:Cobyric acid synthase n=1 Tax=Ignavigranum ruoffiae TaxID=89093 RepID=A0A1H9CG82_9LACT|nr:cobyric acid synthase [Ignavigranum ruoffiae]SEQ00051.1 adenosylcobyric acid synthase (glutamine-hydrolysing) [Ignavigranum ruoffiae]
MKMAKRIMIQGTSSDAGKSLIAAGLCRILSKKGYKVFPFKSQNMALNSYITASGDEMSRAQVVQAEAANRIPEARMNPILLRPVGEAQSEVVILGKQIANTSAAEYYDYKIKLKPMISDIFNEISVENDVIIIEGAGSPAEINLNDHDIVNMGMAEIANSPVILVADIDRGGVFAQIYGTIALMNEKDRQRIKGVIINKFRGDINLLKSGIEMIEDLIKIPIIGVVPYISLNIDSEDSLALNYVSQNKQKEKDINLAILMLSKMSNFSEFQSLQIYHDISVRYIKKFEQLGTPDVLVIPGTEDMKESLSYFRKFIPSINNLIKQGTRIIAINSGMALLGESIYQGNDFLGQGIGVMKKRMELIKEKKIKQVVTENNIEGFHGYLTKRISFELNDGFSVFIHGDNYQDGFAAENYQIIGTQLNGLFQNQNWCREYFNQIRQQKGLQPLDVPETSYEELKNLEYDRLAHHLEKHLDMTFLYNVIGFGED